MCGDLYLSKGWVWSLIAQPPRGGVGLSRCLLEKGAALVGWLTHGTRMWSRPPREAAHSSLEEDVGTRLHPNRVQEGRGHWHQGGEPPGNHNHTLEPTSSFQVTSWVTYIFLHIWGKYH